MPKDHLPDFIVIGAMKCGTSTLAAQLAAQDGVFMTTPKEPNFFSNDEIYENGVEWYKALFETAPEKTLKGEASTHYTKLPTYPDTLARMQDVLPAPKLIYLIRNPMERAVSHFIHEWSEGRLGADLDTALSTSPEIRDYGCYGRQIIPFLDAYGKDRVLLSSLEQLKADPDTEFKRITAFLGVPGNAVWSHEMPRQNVSAERIRSNPVMDWMIQNPTAQALRRTLVPKSVRTRIRQKMTMQDRPEIPESLKAALWAAFLADRSVLAKHFPDHPALTLCYADAPLQDTR